MPPTKKEEIAKLSIAVYEAKQAYLKANPNKDINHWAKCQSKMQMLSIELDNQIEEYIKCQNS